MDGNGRVTSLSNTSRCVSRLPWLWKTHLRAGGMWLQLCQGRDLPIWWQPSPLLGGCWTACCLTRTSPRWAPLPLSPFSNQASQAFLTDAFHYQVLAFKMFPMMVSSRPLSNPQFPFQAQMFHLVAKIWHSTNKNSKKYKTVIGTAIFGRFWPCWKRSSWI